MSLRAGDRIQLDQAPGGSPAEASASQAKAAVNPGAVCDCKRCLAEASVTSIWPSPVPRCGHGATVNDHEKYWAAAYPVGRGLRLGQ